MAVVDGNVMAINPGEDEKYVKYYNGKSSFLIISIFGVLVFHAIYFLFLFKVEDVHME